MHTQKHSLSRSGEDYVESLLSLDCYGILFQLMDLLKEQMFQIQTSCTREEEEEDMQRLAEEQSYGSLFQNRHASSWADMVHPPFMKGGFSSSLSYQSLLSPHFPAAPYQEVCLFSVASTTIILEISSSKYPTNRRNCL